MSTRTHEIKVDGVLYVFEGYDKEDALAAARREFRNTNLEYVGLNRPEQLEYVPIGNEVYLIWSDGREELAATCQTQGDAEDIAAKFNNKLWPPKST